MTCLASSNGSCSSSPSCKGQCSILKIEFNALNCLPKCSKLNSRQTVKCTMLRETFISNKAGRLHTGTHATGRTSRNIDFVKNLKIWHYLIESKRKQITWELSWNMEKTNPLFWSFWSSYLIFISVHLSVHLSVHSSLFHISFCSLIVLYRAAPRLRRGGAVRRSSRAARAAPARSKSAVARGRWCNCPPRVQCLVLCRNMSKHVETHKTI